MKSALLKKTNLFKKTLAVMVAGMVALPASAVWTVKEGKLLDPNGNPFIFRGATVDGTLDPEKTLQAIKDIAAAGANAVQVEINADLYESDAMVTGEQLRAIIDTCKASKVVCVLEPNDVAGYPDFAGAGIPAVSGLFWSWPGIREAIAGQQDYIMLGFGNQALAPMPTHEYIARIQTYLRDYSQWPLNSFVVMIDGNSWSQDQEKSMLELAKQTTTNGTYLPYLIYSVDMFDAYLSPESVRDYIAGFAEAGLPLVIGGFAPTAYYHPNNTAPRPAVVYDLPEDSVMHYAEQYGVGYFGWSWSGNTNPALDLVTSYDAGALTSWGNLLFNGVNGIKATAKPASIFNSSSSSVSSSSSSSSSASNNPPSAVVTAKVEYRGCGSVSGVASPEGSTDPDGDTLTYDWELSSNFSSSVYKSTGPSLRFGMEAVRLYTVKLIVSDGKGGTATASTSLNHFYSDYCVSSSSSSSSAIIRSSSSSIRPSSSSVSSSSIRPSSISSSSRSSSSAIAAGNCSYVINSQWGNGFTAAIRIKNTSAQPINGWNVNWQYSDGSKVTGLWNASLTGSNPYNAKNLGWNATIQPGQTVEFGFQGSKSATTASVPVVTGSICK
ncbi:MAG: man5B [Cellvibrio sp.]|nr:man5B [Cellvibrio sp.]